MFASAELKHIFLARFKKIARKSIVRLRAPHKNASPSGGHEEKYLFEAGGVASLYLSGGLIGVCVSARRRDVTVHMGQPGHIEVHGSRMRSQNATK